LIQRIEISLGHNVVDRNAYNQDFSFFSALSLSGFSPHPQSFPQQNAGLIPAGLWCELARQSRSTSSNDFIFFLHISRSAAIQ